MKIMVVGRGYLANIFRYQCVSNVLSKFDQLDVFSYAEILVNPAVLNCYDCIIYATGPSDARVDAAVIEREQFKASKFLELIDGQKLVLISSGGTVYGDQGNRKLLENDLLFGHTPYAKYQIDLEKAFLSTCSGALILRLSNPYGFAQELKHGQGFIWAAIKACLDDITLEIYGDGRQLRDYIYDVDFLGYALDLIAKNSTGIYNIGSGQSHSLWEVVHIVENKCRKKIRISHKSQLHSGIQISKLDITKLLSKSQYSKKYDLSDGIEEILEYLKGKS